MSKDYLLSSNIDHLSSSKGEMGKGIKHHKEKEKTVQFF